MAFLHSYGPPFNFIFGIQFLFTHGFREDLVAAKCNFSLNLYRKFSFFTSPHSCVVTYLENSQQLRMATDENLHISIGGMLCDDVSIVSCRTLFTLTLTLFNNVETQNVDLESSSKEKTTENGKQNFIHPVFFTKFSFFAL